MRASSPRRTTWPRNTPLASTARRVPRSQAELLEDGSIQLIASAGNLSERGGIGIAAMRHGKDFLSDKPAFTTLDALAEARAVQRETGRIYAVDFGERLRNRAMVKASRAGATPARSVASCRPSASGRIDSARTIDRTGSSSAIDSAASSPTSAPTRPTTSSTSPARPRSRCSLRRLGNLAHPDHPEFEDFGDALRAAATAGRATFASTGSRRTGWPHGATGA